MATHILTAKYSAGASPPRGARHAPPSTSRARASGRTPHHGHERWPVPRDAARTAAAAATKRPEHAPSERRKHLNLTAPDTIIWA